MSSILCLTFNQDYTCFGVGYEDGLRIYSTLEPITQILHRQFKDGGIGRLEMLFRSNYLAFVGGGPNPLYATNKVVLWDDRQQKELNILEFKYEVRNVKLRRDRLIVVLSNKVHVYTLAQNPQKLRDYETAENIRGAISLSVEGSLMAIPARVPGQVQLIDLESFHASASRPIIAAHDSTIACLTLNVDGTLLATSSEKGTLVRIFSTSSGKLLYEFRRGSEPAELIGIVFSGDSSKIVVTSSKETIHVFRLDSKLYGGGNESNESMPSSPAEGQTTIEYTKNRQSSLVFMKDILPKYFSSEWSFAQLKGSSLPSIACFAADNLSIIVISSDGTVSKFTYDSVKGGEARLVYQCSLMSLIH